MVGYIVVYEFLYDWIILTLFLIQESCLRSETAFDYFLFICCNILQVWWLCHPIIGVQPLLSANLQLIYSKGKTFPYTFRISCRTSCLFPRIWCWLTPFLWYMNIKYIIKVWTMPGSGTQSCYWKFCCYSDSPTYVHPRRSMDKRTPS